MSDITGSNKISLSQIQQVALIGRQATLDLKKQQLPFHHKVSIIYKKQVAPPNMVFLVVQIKRNKNKIYESFLKVPKFLTDDQLIESATTVYQTLVKIHNLKEV